MSAEAEQDSQLEIAHVLFTDIVGYSKLPIDQQSELLRELNLTVRSTEQFRAAEAADKLVRLPTGDGMALAFFTSPDAPVRCALEIAELLQSRPEIKLRMGVDSGPVDHVSDVNDRSNVAGAGINMAQRVMDCGDAGHILLSKRVAGDLAQYSKWQPYLHDLGEVEVKHGVRIGVVNFVAGELGNEVVPAKLKRARRQQRITTRRRRYRLTAAALFLALCAGGALWFYSNRARPGGEGDTAAISEKSIAVLPFENRSAEKDDAFFAEGIQDDVLASLSKIKDLKVIARSSVMAYRGEAAAGKLREIGRALQVSHLLQGSVRRQTDRVVINVQLSDTRDDRQIWSERYERTITNALSLQGELALEIAGKLQATLTPAERMAFASKPTENPDAYLLFLRARDLEIRFRPTSADREAAIRFYQQAIDLDPNFALARARLSFALNRHTQGLDAELRTKARDEAYEAMRLRPALGEASLAIAGCYLFGERNYDRALAELARTAELLPNSTDVPLTAATIYLWQGKLRERIAALQRAETLDPRDANVLNMLAMTFRWVRNWREDLETQDRIRALLPDEPSILSVWTRASSEFRLTGKIDAVKKVTAMAPAGVDPQLLKSFQYDTALLERDWMQAERLLNERPPKYFRSPLPKSVHEAFLAVARGAEAGVTQSALQMARDEIEKLIQATPDEPGLHISLGQICAYLGDRDEAIREATRALELSPPGLAKNDASAALALIHARTGSADEAITMIEHLLTVPASLITYHSMTLTELKWRWQWDPLRKDPRFQQIVAGPEPKTTY